MTSQEQVPVRKSHFHCEVDSVEVIICAGEEIGRISEQPGCYVWSLVLFLFSYFYVTKKCEVGCEWLVTAFEHCPLKFGDTNGYQ